MIFLLTYQEFWSHSTDTRVMLLPASPMRSALLVVKSDSVQSYVPMLEAVAASLNLSRKDRNRLMHALVGNTPRSVASSDRCLGFSNPSAATCYLGSALQLLLAVPSITESIASLTSLCTDADCAVCLLCKTWLRFLCSLRFVLLCFNWHAPVHGSNNSQAAASHACMLQQLAFQISCFRLSCFSFAYSYFAAILHNFHISTLAPHAL